MDRLYDEDFYKEDINKIINSDIEWEQLRNKSVLIAGATGLIGRFLVDVIMAKNISSDLGCELIVLVRNAEKVKTVFDPEYFNKEYFKVIVQDIKEKIDIDEEVDFIVNLASNTHPVQYSSMPVDTIFTIINGTKNTLDISLKNPGSRYVFISSVEVYGENRGDVEQFTEDYCGYIDCNTLRAGYPESKRLGEAICQAYLKEYGVDFVTVRLPRVYGPTMKEDDSKALSQFIKKAVSEEDIVLKSEGGQRYSYLYVADAVSGILAVMTKGMTGGAYNVSDASEVMELKDIAATVAKHCGKKVVFELPDDDEKKGFSTATRAILDGTKIRNLGWKPMFSFEEGINRTVAMIKKRNKS